jgi:hypothetical protein
MTRRFAANTSRVSPSKARHRKNRRVGGAQPTDANFHIGRPRSVSAGRKKTAGPSTTSARLPTTPASKPKRQGGRKPTISEEIGR